MAKNIMILDLDYYHHNTDGPNPQAMKLSSYLKQKGYSINFVETEMHLKMNYDEAYIFREEALTPPPITEFLEAGKSKLIGDSFKYFANYAELPPAVIVIRPDYQLYNFENLTLMTRANFIQFFHNGQLLKKRQDFHNTIKGVNKLVVLDEDFWSQDEEDIIWALDFLGSEKHIHFKFPIRLSKVLASAAAKELFLKLHFSQGTQIVFKNDLGHTMKDLIDAIDFIGEIDTKFKGVMSSKLSIASITANHYKQPMYCEYDFIRVLKIIDYAKQKNVRITVKAPKERTYTPFFDEFEFFETWTTNYPHKSFIDAMLHVATKKRKLKWWEILNDSKLWVSNRIKQVISYLLSKPEIMKEYGFRINSTEFDDITKINFDEIEKFRIKSSVEVDKNVKN